MREARQWGLLDVRGAARLWVGERDVALRPKERAVLAAIALIHPGRATPDRIAHLVWGADPPPTARQSVQNHVARIRRAATEAIVSSDTGYALGVGVALRPWSEGHGEPFADLADTPDVAAARAHAGALIDAEADLRLRTAIGDDTEDALALARAAIAAQPYNEDRWRLLAIQLTRRGQRREALECLAAARRQLGDAGLEPGAELRQLEALILDGEVPVDEIVRHGRVVPRGGAPESTAFHPHRRDPFVGRRAEFDLLTDIWSRVRAQRAPHLVVIEGPAGMGKTRLVDRFVAGLDDVRVLHGRNRSSSGLPHAMLVESFAPVLATERQLTAQLGTALGGLTRLLPDAVDAAARDQPDPTHGDTRLARSVRVLVEQLARRPTVWCIDDLQWASPETLAVIEAVLDGIDGPLLVLATARTTEGDVAGALADITTLVGTTTLRPPPLSPDEIGQLIGASAGAVVHARTGGLPLYVSEIARLGRARGASVDVDSIPDAIREWITLRVRALDPATARILELAAAVGEEADVALISAAAGGSLQDVARQCDVLAAAGLLTAEARGTDIPAGHPTFVRFAHAITREVVYDLIGPASRAAHHLAVARALEHTGAHHDPRHAELAGHYARAGTAGHTAAGGHSLLAGQAAYRAGAWTDAVAHLEVAVALADTDHQRAERMVAAGLAQLRAERFAESDQTLRGAIDLARHRGLALVHAEAALALVGRAGRGAAIDATDEERLAILRTAMRHLERYDAPESDRRRWELTMSDLERELAFILLLVDASQERTELLERAVARLRGLDPPDHAALARAILGSRYAKLAPDRLADRLADTEEVLRMGVDLVGYDTLLAAYCYRAEDLLRAGRHADAADVVDDAEFVARRYRDPYWNWALAGWRVVQAIIAGQLDDAEALALTTLQLRPGVPEAVAAFGVELATIRLYEGRPEEVIEPLREAANAHPEIPLYRMVLAQALTQLGGEGRADAREILNRFSDSGFAALPDDTNRFIGLVVLAHVAAELGDREAGARLAELLAPYGDQWSLVNVYGAGGGTWGTAAHARARLAALAGDDRMADELFERALRQTAGAPVERDRIRAHRGRS